MIDLSVARRVFKVCNHDAEFTTAFLGHVDIVPYVVEICAAGDLLDFLESILSRLIFSEPKPLGATVRVQRSPGTIRTVMEAGVLSSVLTLRRGSDTMDLRR